MDLLGVEPIGEDISHLIGFPSSYPSQLPYSHGWFLDTHRAVFSAVLTPKTKIIIELGSWYGASTTWFAENSDAIIFAIDLWDDNFILADNHYMGSKLAQMLREHPLYPTFLANTWKFRDRIVPLRMATTAGMQFLHDRGIRADLIYIDADHHYEAAKLDISTALRLFPDALLVGDDYGNYDDVRRAVHECANSAAKTVHVDNNHCWAYCSITSRTGRNFPPKVGSGGVKRLLDSYRRRGSHTSDVNVKAEAAVSTPSANVTTISVTKSKTDKKHQQSACDEEAVNREVADNEARSVADVSGLNEDPCPTSSSSSSSSGGSGGSGGKSQTTYPARDDAEEDCCDMNSRASKKSRIE